MSDTVRWKLRFENYCEALKTLEEIIPRYGELSELEKDGLIQRFEFTFELTWKLLNVVVRESGIEVYGPKNTFREAEKLGLIHNINVWFDFLYARNLSTHTYEEKTAEEVYKEAKLFCDAVEKLIVTTKFITP